MAAFGQKQTFDNIYSPSLNNAEKEAILGGNLIKLLKIA